VGTSKESALHTWIDQAGAKIVKLNKELTGLRKKYAIAAKNSSVALESLRVLTSTATEAAERSGRAAAKSLTAAKRVAITLDPASHRLLVSAEEAELAAEAAIKAAAEATELVHEVLLAARTVAANEKDAAVIQGSMISVLTAIRSVEAATAATKLAQSVTAFAGSLTLTGH
jgi:hypothetical protein